MNILTRPWTHIFDYKGRSTRREFWLFTIIYYFGIFALASVGGLVASATNLIDEGGTAENVLGTVLGIGLILYVLAFLMASLSLSVRRLHDHDKTGWFLLLSGVPFVGWIFFLIMMLTPGNDYENSYGPDPRLGEPLDDKADVFR
jgi:uncharacterized membrane protein YhaH (DUF805 family)